MNGSHQDRHALYPTGLKDAPTRHRALRQRMAAPGIVVAPGAYDCITARLVEVTGFDALYITGSGVSMSALGAPDMGALSFGEIADRLRTLFEKYVEFHRSEDAATVVCWIVGTYFFPLFATFPRLNIHGEKGTGKSKLIHLISLLAFNGLWLVAPL
jgi:hypothetical protein